MRRRVRALSMAGAVTVMAASALFSVGTPVGAQVTAVDCGSKVYRLLFWPDGHGALKRVPHAATDLPHVDVYTGKGKQFTEEQYVAYADGAAVTTTAVCTPAPLAGSGTASLRDLPQAKMLVCKYPSNPILVAVPESTVERPNLSVVLGEDLVYNAEIGNPGVGSFVGYDDQYCKVKKSPK